MVVLWKQSAPNDRKLGQLVLQYTKMVEQSQDTTSVNPEGCHWEACHFDPIYKTGSSIPDWKFSILTYKTKGGPLLYEFHMVLQCDATTLRYIANHPRWSRDHRPMVLWVIRETLIRIKITEATPLQENKGSFRFGNSTNGALDAEYWTKAHRSAGRLPLVNYANTHVTDMLTKLSETYPEIRPTNEEIEATNRAFYHAREEEQKAQVESQRLARLDRKPGTLSLSIFIDESGDTGFNKDDEFISVAVYLPTDQLNRVRSAVREVLEVCWCRQHPPREIHFSKLKADKLQKVRRFMSLIFRHMGCRGLAYLTLKSLFLVRLSRSEAEFNIARQYPMEVDWDEVRSAEKTATAKWLIACLVDETVSHIVLPQIESIKEISVVHDRKRNDWANEAIARGIEFARGRIEEQLALTYGEAMAPTLAYNCAASETEPCLWLSDWMAWEIQKNPKNGPVSYFLGSVLGSVTCLIINTNGEKVSVNLQTSEKLHVFPDLPREIK